MGQQLKIKMISIELRFHCLIKSMFLSIQELLETLDVDCT